MLSYEIDGAILTLRASGTTTLEQRLPVFDAVRADPKVPNGALLLIDVRGVDLMGEHAVVERLRILLEQLGPKLGRSCAVIVAPALAEPARTFQDQGVGFALTVRLFDDEPSARAWLERLR